MPTETYPGVTGVEGMRCPHTPALQPPEPPNPVPVGLTLDSVLGEWTQKGQCPESEPEPSDVSLLSKIKALYPWSREGCWTAPGYPLSDF